MSLSERFPATHPAGDITALIAGSLMPLAFAPTALYPLAVVLPACLLWLASGISTGRATWRGFLFGVGMYSFGIYWVQGSFEQFGNINTVAAFILTALFVLLLAGFPALLMLVMKWSRADRYWLASLLVFPAGWALLDWVRSWLFTGFPWLALGYSQTDSVPGAFAPLVGVFGVTFITVLVSVALLQLLLSRSLHHRIGWLLLIVAVFVIGAFLKMSDWTQKTGSPLSVALVQGNIAQEIKWRPEQLLDSLDLYMEMIESSLDQDVVVLPETAIPENLSQVPDFVEAVDYYGDRENSAILLGIPIDRHGDSYNGIKAYGKASGEYLKRHLVPFGEYMPWRDRFAELDRLLDAPMSSFRPGPQQQPLLQLSGYPVSLSICYEDAFAEDMFSGLPQAVLLINVSNDGWFGDTSAPHQHLQITRMRAMESGRSILRATNSGISAIIAADGSIQAQTPQFVQTVLKGQVQLRTGSTPFIRYGESPVVMVLAMLLLAGLWTASRQPVINPPVRT